MTTMKSIAIDDIKEIASALSSEIRIKIIKLLGQGSFSIDEISKELEIPLSTTTTNIKQLEDAGLITCEMRPAKRGHKKICIKNIEKLILNLSEDDQPFQANSMVQEMPIGRFRNFEVTPNCGLASNSGIISYVDDPTSFYDPEACEAQIVWFHSGYLEYYFPNRIPAGATVTNFDISFELCAEAPGFNMNWPSDIFLEVNNKLLGIFTSPADFGDKRGLLNPAWWDSCLSQYGQHKRWIVTPEGSFVDGVPASTVKINDLNLQDSNSIIVKIGVRPDAINVGGLNIFGRRFGNYEQDIRLKIDYAL